MSSTNSKIPKVQANFQNLSSAASSLNAASDELTKVVARLDESLRKLNVGLTDWVTFEDRFDVQDPSRYNDDQVGYSKVSGKWGICLRHIWGDDRFDDHHEEGPWLFNDAPREMRLRAVDKISELIESLSKKTDETTRKIQEKTKEVGELALAIEESTRAKSVGPLQNEEFLSRAMSAARKSLEPTGKLSDMAGRNAKEGSK